MATRCRHRYRDVANWGSLEGFQKAIDCWLLIRCQLLLGNVFDREMAWYTNSPEMPWKTQYRCQKSSITGRESLIY